MKHQNKRYWDKRESCHRRNNQKSNHKRNI